MVLGKLSVLGHPTNLDKSRAMPTALLSAGPRSAIDRAPDS